MVDILKKSQNVTSMFKGFVFALTHATFHGLKLIAIAMEYHLIVHIRENEVHLTTFHQQGLAHKSR